jgi:hypothetical protein
MGQLAAQAELDAGLLFAEMSTDEYLAMVDADVRKMLGHPAVDAPTKPKAKTPVRVDRRKKKV